MAGMHQDTYTNDYKSICLSICPSLTFYGLRDVKGIPHLEIRFPGAQEKRAAPTATSARPRTKEWSNYCLEIQLILCFFAVVLVN